MSYKYSYSPWWWTWRGPKHIEVINKNWRYILRILCTKLVSFTRLCRDARSTEHKTKRSKRIWCVLEGTFSEQRVTQIRLHHGACDMRNFGGWIFQIWIDVSREINWSWSLSSGGESESRRLFRWQPINIACSLQDSVEAKVPRSVKADSHIACRAHAAPMPFQCHAVPLIHTCHAASLPCSDSAVSFVKVRAVAGNIRTASPTV